MHLRDSMDRTLLHIASEAGQNASVEFVLNELGEDAVNSGTHTGITALYLAAKEGHATTVRLLVVNYGADVNLTDHNGRTGKLHRL